MAEKQPWFGYERLHSFHQELFYLRKSLAENDRSPKWNMNQILETCSKLSNNKARDRHDMIYELFKPKYAGYDVHNSLLSLFNLIKENMIIPEFFESMSITSFHKSKGSKNLLSNDRGIFNLPKVRSILDRIIYNENYKTIDKNLSFSNAGGRKNRSIRDHLFVVHSIFNDVHQGKANDEKYDSSRMQIFQS